MLTTKKWGGISASASEGYDTGTGGSEPRRRTTLGSGCRVLVGLLLAVLVVGCEPPGRQALLVGHRLLRAGRPADAIEPLKEAVVLLQTNAPACALAWNSLGLAYHQSGNTIDAARAYQNALAKDFNLVVARYNRGCLFLEEDNLAGAINEFTTYTTHRAHDPHGWLRLGTAQLRARLLDGAERSLQKALDQNPPAAVAAEALNNLGIAAALRKRPAEAYQYLNAALKQQTNYPVALFNQAVLAQQQLADRALAVQRYRAYLDSIRPATNAAVFALVQQLEADLSQRAAATNPPPVAATSTNPLLAVRATNLLAPAPAPGPAAPARTNPPPETQAVRTAPATNVVRSNPPVATAPTMPAPTSPTNAAPSPARPVVTAAPSTMATNPPQQPAPPPVEVVNLDTEPPIQPARDLTQAAKPTAAPATITPAPTTPATNPPLTTATVASATPPTPNAAKAPKKSLAQRLNPLGWFGSRDKKEPASPPAEPVTPLRPKATPASASAGPATPKPEAQPAPGAAEPAPSFPRYAYQPPATPTAGDRARAQGSFAAGLQAQRSGDPNQAIVAYKEAASADPAFFEAWYNLGVAAHDAGRWGEALSAYEHALAINPADPSARLNFALALDRANYPIDAAQQLEQVVAATPNDVDAQLSLANLYAQRLGDRKRAREHYQKVLELDPRHAQAPAIRRWLSANR